MSVKMTCYRKTVFADDDTSSIGSIHFNEAASTSPATIHIRYHTGRVTTWDNRTKLEKILIIGSVLITIMTLICISVIFHLAHFIMQQPDAMQCKDTALTNTTTALFMATPNDLSMDGMRAEQSEPTAADNQKKYKIVAQNIKQRLQDFQSLREQSSPSTLSKNMQLKQIISEKMMNQPVSLMSSSSASVPQSKEQIIYGQRTNVPNAKSRSRDQPQSSCGKSCANKRTAICLTGACIHAASDMLHSMDRSINPCTDFYGFACNQWLKNNPIPDGRAVWGTFTKLEQQNQLVVKTVLEHGNEKFKSNAELKAKYYYESCMDDDEIVDKLGAKPLLDLIDNVGGWNVTQPERFHIGNWSLQQTLTKLQNQYNMGGFFAWDVGENDRDSTHYVLQVDQGGLSLPTRDNYLNKTTHAKILSAYLEYMKDIARLLNGGATAANELEPHVVDQLKAVIEFETKIAEITIPAENRRDEEKLYHIMTIKELEQLAPFLDWTTFFNDSFQIINRTIRSDEHVVVYAKDYLKNLSTLIAQYEQTDEGKNTLNNYLMWQTVRTFTTYLSKPFRNAYKNLHKALAGVEGNEEQWRSCVADTNTVMGFAVGAMFVREVFHGNAKPLAENMINDIRNAFKHSLSHLEWMDAETRQLAIDKADAITDMIGFPEYILNPSELDAKYNDFRVNRSEYFGNNVRLGVYNLKRNLEKLYQTVNKTVWGMSPSTVNAYYAPTKNQIVFPAGILQLPFYDIENPESLNYGAMGVVMGHELIHAFDDQGREFDKNGNLYKWWKNSTIERFNERAKCFQKQYDNYQVNHFQINGKSTLGENIADNGGLKASYNAYISLKNMQQRDNDEYHMQLPGLNMTNEQLFFISFAQVWCSSVTNETSKLQIEKDPHAPPRYRVIGALSNLREFSDAFNCPLGSPMNPVKKCEMW